MKTDVRSSFFIALTLATCSSQSMSKEELKQELAEDIQKMSEILCKKDLPKNLSEDYEERCRAIEQYADEDIVLCQQILDKHGEKKVLTYSCCWLYRIISDYATCSIQEQIRSEYIVTWVLETGDAYEAYKSSDERIDIDDPFTQQLYRIIFRPAVGFETEAEMKKQFHEDIKKVKATLRERAHKDEKFNKDKFLALLSQELHASAIFCHKFYWMDASYRARLLFAWLEGKYQDNRLKDRIGHLRKPC